MKSLPFSALSPCSHLKAAAHIQYVDKSTAFIWRSAESECSAITHSSPPCLPSLNHVQMTRLLQNNYTHLHTADCLVIIMPVCVGDIRLIDLNLLILCSLLFILKNKSFILKMDY